MSGLDGVSVSSLVCALAGKVAVLSPLLLYWTPGLAASACFLLLALWPVFRPGTQGKGTTLFSWVLASTFVLLRWPLLSLGELNPDESQILASVTTLGQDPVFWRSVDGGSHGPLVEYPLLLFHLAGLSVDYGQSKLAGMLMMACSFVLLYQALRVLFSDTCARLTVFAPVSFLGLTNYFDFVAYNGETPVLLLLCTAYFLLSRVARAEGRRRAILGMLCGFCLGCVPWAKLQGIPIAGALGLWCLAELWLVRCSRREAFVQSALVLGASLAPSVLFLLTLGLFGVLEQCYVRYIVHNIYYVGLEGLTLWQKFLYFYSKFEFGHICTFYFRGTLLAVIAAFLTLTILYIYNRFKYTKIDRPEQSKTEIFRLVLSMLVFISVVCAVTTPGKFFPHYYLFLFICTSILLSGLLFSIIRETRKKCTQFVIYIIFSATFYFPFAYFEDIYNIKTSLFEIPYICRGKLINYFSDLILEYGTPECSLAVWGWYYRPYVHTGRRIPTCTTPMHIYEVSELQDFYLHDYIPEFVKNQPDFFIDAISTNSFALTDKNKYGFETIPQLKSVISNNYYLLSDVNGMRLYLHKKQNKIAQNILNNLPTRAIKAINQVKATSGDGVFFLDPRIVDSQRVQAYSDAGFYATADNISSDERIRIISAAILQYIDFNDAVIISTFIRKNKIKINYVVTHQILENTRKAGMKLVYNDTIFKIYKIYWNFFL